MGITWGLSNATTGISCLVMGKEISPEGWIRCNSTCDVEAHWTCSGGSEYTKDVCTEICGDGYRVIPSTTRCDDGNHKNGDG